MNQTLQSNSISITLFVRTIYIYSIQSICAVNKSLKETKTLNQKQTIATTTEKGYCGIRLVTCIPFI